MPKQPHPHVQLANELLTNEPQTLAEYLDWLKRLIDAWREHMLGTVPPAHKWPPPELVLLKCVKAAGVHADKWGLGTDGFGRPAAPGDLSYRPLIESAPNLDAWGILKPESVLKYLHLCEMVAAAATAAPGPPAPTKCVPPAKLKGIPHPEAEIRVREWLAANAKDNPVTRDAVAAGTGVGAGQVSNTAAWKAYRERRDSEAKPVAREVPLTDAMQAVVPADCARPDELAALIDEQRAEEAEQERRHKHRHGPS